MSKALQYLTDERGEKTAVVVPISDYERLIEDLEDLGGSKVSRGDAESAEHPTPNTSLRDLRDSA